MLWQRWESSAFEKARAERRPVFLHLALGTSRLCDAVEAVYARREIAALLSERFVPVRVEADDRPDIASRYANKDNAPVALSPRGAKLAVLTFFSPEDLAASLTRCADAYAAGAADGAGGPPPPDGASREGVRRGEPSSLDAAWPPALLGRLQFDHAGGFPCPDCLELLLYGAREWKSPDLKDQLRFQLSRLAKSDAWDRKEGGFARADEVRRLDVNARLARLYLDASTLTGGEEEREVGLKTADFLLRTLFDDRVGAFRFAEGSRGGACYIDANAMAAVAMFRCAALGKSSRYHEAADGTLLFLGRMFDEETGMAHRWDGQPSIRGLLGDNAWAALALTESFLSTGKKTHRELGDAILRLLFQQFWESEKGGFLDRCREDDAVACLKTPLMPFPQNAVALEAAWRLQHLKGNVHYGRWTAAAVGTLVSRLPDEPCAGAPLARIQDMLQRGRVDLELVGRVGDTATEEMLAALNRHYLPRKIVSFVDPDDQDFILPHKLKTPTWPRLFGCIDLKPKAQASRPDEIGGVLDAIS